MQQDAFSEFLEADVVDLKAIARNLPAAKLRALVQNPKLPQEYRNLSGYLLGLHGEENDALLLRRVLENRQAKGVPHASDSLLKGYVLLKPKEGWKFVVDKVRNKNNEFLERYCCLLTARYFYTEHPDIMTKKEILQLLDAFLNHEDMADFAIDDLRKWQRWECTAQCAFPLG